MLLCRSDRVHTIERLVSGVAVYPDGLIPIEEVSTDELANVAVPALVTILVGVGFLVLEVVAGAVRVAHGVDCK
jgi:hypothetical protein